MVRLYLDKYIVGITAGSVAAGVQSGIGSVEAGSIFAVLQSAGMAGISAQSTFCLALGGAGIARIIDDTVDDKCVDAYHLQVLKTKFKNIQHFIMEEIDKLDMDSIKAQYHNIRDSLKSKYNNVADKINGIDWNEKKESVKFGYDTVKDKVMDKINEVDWDAKKESVKSMYETGKNKIKDYSRKYVQSKL